MEIVQLLGAKLTVLLALVALAYFFFSFAPILWPALRAFRPSKRLQRPWLFVAVICTMAYGLLSFLLMAIIFPAEAYSVYVAPQLREGGMAYGETFVQASDFIAKYWWLVLPPAQFAFTFYLTRKVSARWDRICAALAG